MNEILEMHPRSDLRANLNVLDLLDEILSPVKKLHKIFRDRTVQTLFLSRQETIDNLAEYKTQKLADELIKFIFSKFQNRVDIYELPERHKAYYLETMSIQEKRMAALLKFFEIGNSQKTLEDIYNGFGVCKLISSNLFTQKLTKEHNHKLKKYYGLSKKKQLEHPFSQGEVVRFNGVLYKVVNTNKNVVSIISTCNKQPLNAHQLELSRENPERYVNEGYLK